MMAGETDDNIFGIRESLTDFLGFSKVWENGFSCLLTEGFSFRGYVDPSGVYRAAGLPVPYPMHDSVLSVIPSCISANVLLTDRGNLGFD